jgi:Ca-activated chloride channel family protein
MFNQRAFENSRPDGIAVLEIDGDQPRFVPLRRTELRGEIAGPLASLRVTHVYAYTKEQCEHPVEATYRFPLPGDAAVTGVRVTFGDVEIDATLVERAQAEQQYEEAKQQGRQAALLTRETPDVFSLRVTGIEPDQAVTVMTSYTQLARPEGFGWSLRVPLTTAPRYVRADELRSRYAEGQPLMLLRDPGHVFALDLSLPGAVEVRSATHAVQTTEDGKSLHVQLRNGSVVPDRDLVLTWLPRQEERRAVLSAWIHKDADQLYFLASATPPFGETGKPVPREVIVHVDHSGSMEGAKWEAADWAVKQFLASLNPGDRFNLGLFHNLTRWFSTQPCPADRETIARAETFLTTYRDSGGTDLGVALEQGLRMRREPGAMARHVLLITDAEVSDVGRILRLADEEWERAEHRRISVLCIDAAPNSFLATELAERGGGIARFLTSAPDEEDITTALDVVLADWSQPVYADLRLCVNRPEVTSIGSREQKSGEAAAIDLGDLPGGRSRWVAGRVPLAGPSDLRLWLETNGSEVAATSISLAEAAGNLPALKALFGARRVLGLEFLMHAGYQPQELAGRLARLGYDPDRELSARRDGSTLYAENTRADAEGALRSLLVREALSYGLVSAETAFVAVRKVEGRRVGETVVVANALPSGWSAGFLNAGGYAPSGLARSMPPPAALFRQSAASLGASAVGAAPLAQNEGVMPLQEAMADIGMQPMPIAMSAPASGGAYDMVRGFALGTAANAAGVFSGNASTAGGQTVLFGSDQPGMESTLPDSARFSRLRVHFPDGAPLQKALDPRLTLLLYVDDLAAPRATVRLADLVRQGGMRPLNVTRRPGQIVRLVLDDPSGVWKAGGPHIVVTLEWGR